MLPKEEEPEAEKVRRRQWKNQTQNQRLIKIHQVNQKDEKSIQQEESYMSQHTVKNTTFSEVVFERILQHGKECISDVLAKDQGNSDVVSKCKFITKSDNLGICKLFNIIPQRSMCDLEKPQKEHGPKTNL
jgi:hypothetical protein